MTKALLALWLFILLDATTAFGQIVISGDLEDRIKDHINALPDEDGNDYAKPTDIQFQHWGETLAHLLNGDYSDASSSAAAIDYNLIEFTDDDTDRVYYILENNNINYWGTYVYYPNYLNQLVVQSPHPKKDFNTGKQGVYVFKNTESMFFFLSGTNRCNAGETVDCSGETEVCGPKGAFKKSDMAHNDSTFFQSATDTLFQRFADSYFLQLHGFEKKVLDPYVILSNGSKELPANDFITVLKNKLKLEDGTLSFEVPHENEDWDRLIGRTNTQGRLINGSTDACGLNATINSGRFIHMEQEKTKLRSNESGWMTVSNAVQSALVETLPVEFRYFTIKKGTGESINCEWSTLTEVENDYFEIQRSSDGEDWDVIGKTKGAGNSNKQLNYQFTDVLPLRGMNYYRLKQVDFDGSESYSVIKLMKSRRRKPIEISLFPNPATDRVVIRSGDMIINEVIIYDLLAQNLTAEILLEKSDTGILEIDISSLNEGVYFLVLNQSTSMKLIKY